MSLSRFTKLPKSLIFMSSYSVDFFFQFLDCPQVAFLTAEKFSDTRRVSHPPERVEPEYLCPLDFCNAVIGVLLKERLDDLPCHSAVLMQEVTLLHVLGTLSPGQRFLVVSHMCDEVEVIDILHVLVFL